MTTTETTALARFNAAAKELAEAARTENAFGGLDPSLPSPRLHAAAMEYAAARAALTEEIAAIKARMGE